jgi:hypothetical protein
MFVEACSHGPQVCLLVTVAPRVYKKGSQIFVEACGHGPYVYL